MQVAKCQNCLTPFDDDSYIPLALSCKHTICKSCASKLHAEQANYKCKTCSSVSVVNPSSQPLDLKTLELIGQQKVQQLDSCLTEINGYVNTLKPNENEIQKAANDFLVNVLQEIERLIKDKNQQALDQIKQEAQKIQEMKQQREEGKLNAGPIQFKKEDLSQNDPQIQSDMELENYLTQQAQICIQNMDSQQNKLKQILQEIEIMIESEYQVKNQEEEKVREEAKQTKSFQSFLQTRNLNQFLKSKEQAKDQRERGECIFAIQSNSTKIKIFDIKNTKIQEIETQIPFFHETVCIEYCQNLFIIGGFDYQREEAFKQTYLFIESVFLQLGDLIQGRGCFGICICQNKLFVVGGKSDNYTILNTVEWMDLNDTTK